MILLSFLIKAHFHVNSNPVTVAALSPDMKIAMGLCGTHLHFASFIHIVLVNFSQTIRKAIRRLSHDKHIISNKGLFFSW